ncbi:MAG TPA: ATP-binding protein, partial [Kofleriaceae bacterium]|nr:ATP-binding protein [Kofleriaceae bacterium]
MIGIDDVPGALVAVDERQVIQIVNRAARELLGYAADALVGRPLRAILSVSSALFVETHVTPALVLLGSVDELYMSLLDRARSPVPVIARACRRQDGGATFMFLSAKKRHLLQEDLATAHAEAERAVASEATTRQQLDALQTHLAVNERLVSIGELAAEVAHEVHGPLSYVTANVELLLANATGEDAAMLADVQRGLSRIRGIAGSLKKLARPEIDTQARTDLAEVVSEASVIARLEIERRGALEMELPQTRPEVLGDEVRLGQLVLNLMVNAAHALPVESRATNRVRVIVRHCGDHAELVVEDNGIGITPEVQARMFEAFFTTKPAGMGTGLGLSVCRQIVDAHRGTIDVWSTLGQGTRFTVRLPTIAPVAAAPQPTGAPRLMVVDDDEGVYRVLRRVFQGYEVVWCNAGQVALDR